MIRNVVCVCKCMYVSEFMSVGLCVGYVHVNKRCFAGGKEVLTQKCFGTTIHY